MIPHGSQTVLHLPGIIANVGMAVPKHVKALSSVCVHADLPWHFLEI